MNPRHASRIPSSPRHSGGFTARPATAPSVAREKGNQRENTMILENFTKKLLAGSALVAASALPQKSDAQVIPYMNVDTSTSTSNYDFENPLLTNTGLTNPGDETKFQYTITNFGDGDPNTPDPLNPNTPDGAAYNLISFTVLAGSNQSVFNYEGSGFSGSIGSDSTTFTGSLTPGSSITFELWADDATPTSSIVQSTALASGTGVNPNQPFRDYDNGNLSSNQYVSVTAPVPEPSQGALLLALGAGAAALGQRRYSPKAEEKPIRFF